MYIAELLTIVHSLSPVWLFVIPWTSECKFSLSFTIYWSLLKLMSVESGILFNHFIVCRPLLLPSLLASIMAFFNKSTLQIRWLKYWSFSFSFSHANEYSRLTSFKTDWFDLPVVQGTPKSPLQLMGLHACRSLINWSSVVLCKENIHTLTLKFFCDLKLLSIKKKKNPFWIEKALQSSSVSTLQIFRNGKYFWKCHS